MTKLNSTQITNLKIYWEKEGLYLHREYDYPVRVFFDGATMDWFTWEEISNPNCWKFETPETNFYYDTSDEDMAFETLCKYAEAYINTGAVATFYH